MFRKTLTSLSLGLLLSGCGGLPNPFHDGPRSARGPDKARIPYGTQDGEDVTGAISSVPMEDNAHVQDVLDMLRNHVPGLHVMEGSNGDIQLRIRGFQQSLRTDNASNQPLIVIDDMPVLPGATRMALRGLVPHEVESIHVLKDVSSTAIYGSRGANGVILIHMKR